MENRRVRIVNKRLIPGVMIPSIWEPRTFPRVSRFFELHLTGPKALAISQSDRASAPPHPLLRLQQISNHYSVGVVLHQHAPGDCNHALRQSSGVVLSRGTRQTALDFQLGGVRGKGRRHRRGFRQSQVRVSLTCRHLLLPILRGAGCLYDFFNGG
jgi:hypothetical protein